MGGKGDIAAVVERMRAVRPRDRGELGAYLEAFLGLKVPGKRICAGHDSPMDYLAWGMLGGKREKGQGKRDKGKGRRGGVASRREFEEKREKGRGKRDKGQGEVSLRDEEPMHGQDAHAKVSGDCVVWANRGGGKTQLGAVLSLLEGVFFDGCQVRILGGAEEQSQRMYEYLRKGLDRGFERLWMGG